MPNPTAPVPLDQRLKQGIADYVTNEIERGIRRQFDIVTDPAGFIADSEPAPPTSQFAKSVVRRVCRAWARGQTPITGPLADFTYGPLCTPYLDSIGEDPSPPQFSRPFPGGQCSGVTYVVGAVSQTRCPAFATDVSSFVSGPGPVQLVGKTVVDTGMFPVPFRTTWTIRFADGDRSFSFRHDPGIDPCIRAFRADGLPDTCGSTLPDYLAPQPTGTLPPIDGQPIDLPGVGPTPFTVSFDNDGNITVSFPDLGIDFSVPNPLLPADGTGEDIPPGEQGTAGETETGENEPVEGEDETRNLVGVRVAITSFPARANVNTNSQGAYYKGAYYVYMGGDAGLAQHPAAIVKPTQFFYADKGSNKWRVEPNFGYSVAATPFFED